jgi:8-oxo-dGTP diphosphatase
MINVRVYGILINEKNEILVSDELIRGMRITKFCGGGLEEGEGTRACLKREFMEEMNLEVEVQEHFYTTDFYQPSAFRKDDQILSIYYKVKPLQPITAKLSTISFDFDETQLNLYENTQQIENFRFISVYDFDSNNMTLPIDKFVADLVKEEIYRIPF